MAQKFSNNATTVLSGAISAVQTNINVSGGGGTLFPSVNANDVNEYSICTIEDNLGNFEIVKVNGHGASSDSFSVTRGYEGTTARTFAAGDRYELRLSAEALGTFLQKDGDVIDGGSFT